MSIIEINNGDCLELMKDIPDKSVDLFICDLPYAETNCKWDVAIDMEKFWSEFRRLRASPRTACIHFCSTKFGYTLIKSWEKGYKMDMVWKKRNKTGGLQSRHRPMRNHEMVYFFYEQAPKYNRDKYHKRIQAKNPIVKEEGAIFGKGYEKGKEPPFCKSIYFEPPNPASVLEEKNEVYGKACKGNFTGKNSYGAFEPPNPASVVEEDENKILTDDNRFFSKVAFKGSVKETMKDYKNRMGGLYEPVNPVSVLVAEDEPVSMFESTKVFIGKRHHQTEKPQDILEFFLKYWTDEGDTVLDPTMGSGSTGVACKKLGRNFIGYELDEKIFKVAKARIEK